MQNFTGRSTGFFRGPHRGQHSNQYRQGSNAERHNSQERRQHSRNRFENETNQDDPCSSDQVRRSNQRGSSTNWRNNRDHRRNDNRPENSRKPRQMGFKYVESLLENDDIEDVIFILSNDRRGFSELLEDKNITNDMIILLVNLFCKISNSSFTHSKINLLQRALGSTFIDSLIKFISTLAIQGVNEKKANKYFWRDPDGFWNSIINISNNFNDLIPTTSCDSMLKVLKTLKINMPIIETEHSIHISDEIKATVDSLYDVVNKTSREVERKKEIGEVYIDQMELEPPDDFRQISLYPNTAEVTIPDPPFLRPNVVRGPYQNIHHYLDVQFRLLREDFVAPLRKGICKYLSNSKERLEDIKIYNPVRFLNMETVNEQNCYRVQYDFTKKKRTFQYENSKRFMYGALLCFTPDNFQTLLFGKIVQRDVKDLEKGQLIVGFNEDIKLPDELYEQDYLMVESTVYFEPYYHVLNVLKNMQLENFPMEKYIIRVETDTRPPEYLLPIDPIFYKIEDSMFWPLNWPDKRFYNLNDAQHIAFKAALTQEFAIIQGPPGTGKTFLGLKIAHTLLKNKSAWYKRTPLLVICYTNHALDQFLEGLMEVTEEILRVGSQSKNEKLNKFNIRNTKYRTRNPAVAQKRHEVRACLQTISTIGENLKAIELNESVLDFSVFAEVVPKYTGSWFYNAKKEDILKWLFSGTRDVTQQRLQGDRNQVFQNLQYSGQLNENNDTAMEEETFDINDNELVDEVFEGLTVTSVKPLISLKNLWGKMQILRSDWNKLQANTAENGNIQNMLQEEQLLDELYRTEADLRYLEKRLSERDEFINQELTYVDLCNPHNMAPRERWHLYFTWVHQYALKLIKKREMVSKEFRKIFRVYNEMRDMEDTQIMKESLVVGMTTTGAARLHSSLRSLKSPVVIVEEAAEVLEAHIISALTSNCKHLILIGDHQQLKPSTADFKIETKYLLGISLFERMVLNKIQCHMLNVQHRMRPEISCLIRPTIYPVLKDHESVLTRPPILGVENCVYFIDHQEPEQLCKDSSKKNIHEAKFLILFAKHLILNGYKPENITILAAYLGQMFEMQREKKQHNLLLQDVRIAVLDNYQGEESDIILLSLVRSNAENKIGFLKNENRVCVALSRARNGFYMIGNMTQLRNNSEVWPKINKTLENQNAVGPYLTLRCQIHKQKITQVRSADDFLNIPEGGCDLLCEAQIACGHICKRLCHIEDRDHAYYKCLEKCNRNLCNTPEHICLKLCYQDCGPCTYPVKHDLDCGHSVTIDCFIDPATHKCTVLVNTKLPCGHEAEKPCHSDPETFRCPHPCDTRVEPCGHACSRNCHIRNDPDHLEYSCRKPCAKFRIGCTNQDQETHRCSNYCFQDCEVCEVGVKKHRSCKHVYQIACSTDVESIECLRPCKKMLPCGHHCKNKCSEPCGNCKVMVDKTVPDCNHVVKIRCSEEPERKHCRGKCPRLLDCGHNCMKKCDESCTSICKVEIDCSIPSPCGHIIKKIQCSLKNAGDPAILLKKCTEKCKTELKCKHPCSGTCGQCSQGRIHQRCREKCGVPLVCNHECPIPCRQACKPCIKECGYKCKHSKCKKRCGDPCSECKEKCPRQCQHQKCNRKCGEICDVPPCNKPCERPLKCGHNCVGFCGDPCPKLCRKCDYEELTTIVLGNEDEEGAIYVMLVDCGHTFESSDLDYWMRMESHMIKAKVCPQCKTPIATTQRYSEYIKNGMKDVMNVKIKSFGTPVENEARRNDLLAEIEQTKLNAVGLYEASWDLRKALETLKARLQKVKSKNQQSQRQDINRADLDAVRSKLQVIQFATDTYNNQKRDAVQVTDQSMANMSFLLKAVMLDDDRITDQEIDDFGLEIERLCRVVQFEKIQEAKNFQYCSTKTEVQKVMQEIKRLAEINTRYSKQIDEMLKNKLLNFNKLIEASVAISEVEKKEIVRAMGLQKGHWFKCPNGHLYVITECGGAMEISTCNECGAKIGGNNHALLPDQMFAGDMDGAQYPAWSEAANLANYRL